MLHAIRRAFPYTVPVLFGYSFLGIAFGLLTIEAGLPPWMAPFSSFVVYAGSMQFVLVGLVGTSISAVSLALLTLSINGRFLFYGIPLLEEFRGAGATKPYLIHTLSDETFALMTAVKPPEDVSKIQFYLSLGFLNQMYWIFFTALGALFGTMVQFNTKGLDFVMTALFIAIFTDQWITTRERRPALIGVLSSTVSIVIFSRDTFILPAMAFMIVVLFLMRYRIEGRQY